MIGHDVLCWRRQKVLCMLRVLWVLWRWVLRYGRSPRRGNGHKRLRIQLLRCKLRKMLCRRKVLWLQNLSIHSILMKAHKFLLRRWWLRLLLRRRLLSQRREAPIAVLMRQILRHCHDPIKLSVPHWLRHLHRLRWRGMKMVTVRCHRDLLQWRLQTQCQTLLLRQWRWYMVVRRHIHQRTLLSVLLRRCWCWPCWSLLAMARSIMMLLWSVCSMLLRIRAHVLNHSVLSHHIRSRGGDRRRCRHCE